MLAILGKWLRAFAGVTFLSGLALTTTGASHAMPVVYTNLATFQSAVSALSATLAVETFEGFSVGSNLNALASLGLTISTTNAYVSGANGGFVISGSNVLLNGTDPGNAASSSLVFAHSGQINAFGFWNTSRDDNVTVDLFNGSVETAHEVAVAPGGFSTLPSFLGIIDLAGFDSFVIRPSAGNQFNGWISIDDLQLATAPRNVVPEPGSLALAGLALAGLALARRSKNRA